MAKEMENRKEALNKKEDDKSSGKMEENSTITDNHQPPTYKVGS